MFRRNMPCNLHFVGGEEEGEVVIDECRAVFRFRKTSEYRICFSNKFVANVLRRILPIRLDRREQRLDAPFRLVDFREGAVFITKGHRQFGVDQFGERHHFLDGGQVGALHFTASHDNRDGSPRIFAL